MSQRLPTSVFVYDDEGRYIAVNARGAEILGCDADELMEHNVSDFAPGAVDPSLLYSDGFRTGTRLIRRQDGQEVEVGYAVAPTRVGHLPHRVAVVWEIAAP